MKPLNGWIDRHFYVAVAVHTAVTAGLIGYAVVSIQ